MKTKPLAGTLAVIMFVILVSSSCEKTIVNDIYDCECVDTCNTETPTTPKPPSCTEMGTWLGRYSSLSASIAVADSTFISNGIARMGNSPYGYYWTGIELPFPACRNLAGDSMRLDARVKNPLNEGSIEELDVVLVITGEQDSAWVNYIGRATHVQHTYLGLLNGSQLNNVPELIQMFQDWTEVSLEVKNNVVSTYKNGTLIKTYTIPSGKKLGKVKNIKVGFKGTGSVDWVKVYNNAGTLKAKEEFNNGTKSQVEWF
jgi:hypothetical protein